MPADRETPSHSTRALLALALAGAALWLWISFCRFPWISWNDVRLEPAFMAAAGVDVYSPPGRGVITTWIYGPVPLYLLRPATWMPDAGSALMMAGSITLLFQLTAIFTACIRRPGPPPSLTATLTALLIVIACWPGAAWRFIQADNFAVAFGLFSNALLLAAPSRERPDRTRWLAAVAAVAAIGCKQTSLGLLAAQVIWLAWETGWRQARDHFLRCSAAGSALLMVLLAGHDPTGLWYNLVAIPGRLPNSTQLGQRFVDLSPLLGLHVVLPALLFAWWGRLGRLDGVLRLAFFTWLCSLPLGLLGLMKIGGTINSLQGLPLALPALATTLAADLRPHRRRLTFAAAAIAAVFALRIALVPHAPLRPLTRHLDEAASLLTAQPGRIWLPWNPLVSHYAEGGFYHSEDGLYIRYLAGAPFTYDQARAHLPARFDQIGILSGGTDWGLAHTLLPAPLEETNSGMWRITRQAPSTP